jgi:predicted N-acetyltransferase YhbS
VTGSLTFRRTGVVDAAPRRAVKALLGTVFGLDFTRFDALGLDDPSTVSFSAFEGELCVANISAFAMPVIAGGQRLRAFGLQSGAVLPAYRGRGLYRRVTGEALAWCEAQGAELLLLYTDKPALYTPWGFATLPEHRFVGQAPQPSGTAASRRLSLDSEEDVALLHALLERRAPVSERFGVLGHASMALFNLLARPTFTVDWLDGHGVAVVTANQQDGSLRLIDIIGPAIPSLAALIGALGVAPRRIEVSFPTDRLGWDGTGQPRGADIFMGCGPRLHDLPFPLGLPETASF